MHPLFLQIVVVNLSNIFYQLRHSLLAGECGRPVAEDGRHQTPANSPPEAGLAGSGLFQGEGSVPGSLGDQLV